MDEEERIRARLNSLSAQINAGAAGALGNPIYKKEFPTNVSSNLFNVESPGTPFEQLAIPGDVIEGGPSLFDRLFGLTERIDSQGNVIPEYGISWDSDTNLPVFSADFSTIRHSLDDGDYRYKPYPDMSPIQRGAFNVQFKYGQDPVGELIDRTPLGMLLDIPGIDYIVPNVSEAVDFKFNPPVEEIKIIEGDPLIEEYTPLEFEPFEYGHWTEGLGEPNPEIGGGYGVYGDPELDYYNLRREAVEKGLYPEYSGPEFGGYGTFNTPPEYNVWADNAIPVIHDEEERKWQLEYDAAREAFDRRNEEEERRHREEYDKIISDAMMDTDFSMGDLEPDDFWTTLDKFLESTVGNPIFDRPEGWGEAAEITPPSWLTPEFSTPNSEENVVTDYNIYDAIQSLLDRPIETLTGQPGLTLDTLLTPQRGTFPNPNLFLPDTEFNTNIPNASGGGGGY